MAMRVYVVGGPGSGKTTLADALGNSLRVPVVHLDDHWSEVFEHQTTGPARATTVQFRDVLVADCLARDGWIIEGAEPPFLAAFAQASDLILWCDVPFRVAAFRITRRHIVADLRRTNAYGGYRRLYRFLRSVRRRYGESPPTPGDEWTGWTRALVAEGVARHPAKVIRVDARAPAAVVRPVLERARNLAGHREPPELT